MRFALVVTLFAGACGEADTTADDEPEVNCAEEMADEYVVGLPKSGSVHDVKLASALPAPPGRGDNAWIIEIAARGTAVTGAGIEVTPFMNKPQAHGTPIKVTVTEMPTAGQYSLSRVNLWMPGVWETTIAVTSAAGTDEVVYRFCIPK